MMKRIIWYLAICLCLARPSSAALALVDTATGSACSNNACATTANNFTATISSGVTCAIIGLTFRNNVTSTAVTWDTAGANQSFVHISGGGGSTLPVFNGAQSDMFQLVNPTAGASKIVTVTWTTNSDVVWTLATFSGTQTTGSSCIKTADTITATGAASPVTVTVNSSTTEASVGIGGQNSGNWIATTGGTAITLNNVTFTNGAGSYFDPTHSSASTNTHSWTFGGGAWSAAAVHIALPAAAAGGAILLIRDAS